MHLDDQVELHFVIVVPVGAFRHPRHPFGDEKPFIFQEGHVDAYKAEHFAAWDYVSANVHVVVGVVKTNVEAEAPGEKIVRVSRLVDYLPLFLACVIL